MSEPLTVDLVFQAIDRSRDGTVSFVKQIESVDQVIRQTTERSRGGEAGGLEPNVTRLDSMVSRLTNRLIGAQGVKLGIDAITLGIRVWKYETTKLTSPLDTVLENHIKINDSVKELVRDVPFVGRAIARMMDAFGDDDKLKQVAETLKSVEASTAATFLSLRRGVFDVQKMQMEVDDSPKSETMGVDAAKAQQARQDEIAALKKKVADAKEVISEKQKMEDSAAQKAYRMQGLEELATYRPKEAYLDRTESERARKEVLDPAENALRAKESDDAIRRGIEKNAIEKQQFEEMDNDLALQVKRYREKTEWETEQNQRLEELKAKQIEDRVEREKELINIKYNYEEKRARDAGMNIDSLERQRAIELEGVKPDEKKKSNSRVNDHFNDRRQGSGFSAEELQFAPGSGLNYGYQDKAERHRQTQVDLLKKILQSNQRLLQSIRAPGVGNPPLFGYS
jgi:hypothetical protein